MSLDVTIEQLFDASRFPQGLALIPILLYVPIGVILGVLRFFIALHAYIIACVLPKSFYPRRNILRALCAVLGLIVTIDDKTKSNDDTRETTDTRHLLVCNHVSLFDHVAIGLLIPNITPSVWAIPSGLAWLLGYSDFGVDKGIDVLVENIKKHYTKSESRPVLVFPEGGTTNTSTGLLKFSQWPFDLEIPIQPMSLRIQRPSLLPISLSPIGSRWWSDGLWFLFTPYTLFKLELLPVLHIQSDEVCEQFTKRTERCMAASLGVSNTPYTDKDKVEFVKRQLFDENSGKSEMSPAKGRPCPTKASLPKDGDTEVLEQMSAQVKAVLPDVDMRAIQVDIAKTRNVDETITNFVEGKVSDDTTPQPSSPNSSLQSMVFGSTQFSKNASTREMSFKERKQQMLDTAREVYQLKHGLVS